MDTPRTCDRRLGVLRGECYARMDVANNDSSESFRHGTVHCLEWTRLSECPNETDDLGSEMEDVMPAPLPRRIPAPVFVSLTLATLAGVLFTSCGNDKKPNVPPPPDAYPESDTIELLFENFERAYIEKNADEYARLFHKGDFYFAFAQVDRDQNPDVPPRWNWTAEKESADGLFESALVSTIRCNVSTRDTAVPATAADELGRPDLQGVLKVRVREARLEVDTVDPQGGGLTLQVDGDAQEFFIALDDHDAFAPQHAVWKIVYWKDRAIATGRGGRGEGGKAFSSSKSAGTQTTTWGQVKRSF